MITGERFLLLLQLLVLGAWVYTYHEIKDLRENHIGHLRQVLETIGERLATIEEWIRLKER